LVELEDWKFNGKDEDTPLICPICGKTSK